MVTGRLKHHLHLEPRYPAAHPLLARAALRQDDRGLADRHLQTAVDQRPDDVAVHQLLGELSWQDNRPTDAILHFRLALRAQNADAARPETVLARLSLAMALRKEGYLTAAADQLQAYLDAVGAPTPEMQNHDELSRVIELYLGTAAGRLAEIHSELGRHEDAVQAYRRANPALHIETVGAPRDVPLKILQVNEQQEWITFLEQEHGLMRSPERLAAEGFEFWHTLSVLKITRASRP